jgi:hypothetical protein
MYRVIFNYGTEPELSRNITGRWWEVKEEGQPAPSPTVGLTDKTDE